MSKDTRNAHLCPYWSGRTQRCGVDDDGLFIPLEAYVECYCTSSDHKVCQHLHEVEPEESEESVVERIRNLHTTIMEDGR